MRESRFSEEQVEGHKSFDNCRWGFRLDLRVFSPTVRLSFSLLGTLHQAHSLGRI